MKSIMCDKTFKALETLLCTVRTQKNSFDVVFALLGTKTTCSRSEVLGAWICVVWASQQACNTGD